MSRRDYKILKADKLLPINVILDSVATTATALRRDAEGALRACRLNLPAGVRYDEVHFEYQDEDGDWCGLHDGSFRHFPSGRIKLRLVIDPESGGGGGGGDGGGGDGIGGGGGPFPAHGASRGRRECCG